MLTGKDSKLSSSNGLLVIDQDQFDALIKNVPISDVYDVEQTPFARGKFAAVRRAKHRETGVWYAAKCVRKRRRALREEILHEIAVLALASQRTHRIVSIVEVYETPSEMALVLELCAGGELQRVVDMQDGLEENEAAAVMRQILEALVFLHDHQIAHLDLKPQNMLLTGDYPECDIKLCDFGISRIIQPGTEVREIMGTPDYVAPEVLSYEPISLATDVWSVGVVAYVLLSGYSPFAGDTKQETFCNISQCSLSFPSPLFDNVSPVARDFIASCLVVDPKGRMTARECLEHSWLTAGIIKSPSMLPCAYSGSICCTDYCCNGCNSCLTQSDPPIVC